MYVCSFILIFREDYVIRYASRRVIYLSVYLQIHEDSFGKLQCTLAVLIFARTIPTEARQNSNPFIYTAPLTISVVYELYMNILT